MKKLLLSLGTVAAIAAPVASVVACGNAVTEVSKTVTSRKTDAMLKVIDQTHLDSLAAKSVSDLEAMFGITSGAPTTSALQDGITYKAGVLTFKAGPLGEEKTYTITITPKA